MVCRISFQPSPSLQAPRALRTTKQVLLFLLPSHVHPLPPPPLPKAKADLFLFPPSPAATLRSTREERISPWRERNISKSFEQVCCKDNAKVNNNKKFWLNKFNYGLSQISLEIFRLSSSTGKLQQSNSVISIDSFVLVLCSDYVFYSLSGLSLSLSPPSFTLMCPAVVHAHQSPALDQRSRRRRRRRKKKKEEERGGGGWGYLRLFLGNRHPSLPPDRPDQTCPPSFLPSSLGRRKPDDTGEGDA